ncbi:Superoxide dismutase [Pseudomonas syringae pv. primulae]|uniref:Superoxide dismutase [Cu-Zn] n=2 Tax=Pseudomonas syringae group genomosp. 3 TaxID=251701 RepID=A0A3M5U4X1_9PSED|nr:Superoxide dismutase [Pseudomonas syringae pv. primulae]RMU40975.1 Superoxide dismutase [Pseudomonas syringae pv. primulae]
MRCVPTHAAQSNVHFDQQIRDALKPMKPHLWLGLLGAFSLSVQAASLDVPINLVSADGAPKPIGSVTVSETEYGLLFTPKLTGLPAGVHGFHVHENGSCEAGTKDGVKVAALAAGGHFDPARTGKHLGPYAQGHLGDLPALYVTADGTATYPVLAPRLKKLSEIKGHALMVHAGGDNHADMPKPLGGGGDRAACGVI